MDFPRLVYTSPGPNECQGGSYGQELVKDEYEYEAALKAGFFATLPEAIDGNKGKSDEVEQSEESGNEGEIGEPKEAKRKQRGRPAKS